MGWKRETFELFTRACAARAPRLRTCPDEPRSIFVLRNNDIGDLLVVTPLFEALKRRFPNARIVAGVGSWNFDVLKRNPFVDEVLPVNAPWHNGQVRPQGMGPALRYILTSAEAAALARCRFDIGIDVLGSQFGALLMLRCGIPFRLGVKGYAGGHTAMQRVVEFDETLHVGAGALRFAALLGASELPENRPQIYLDEPLQTGGHIVIAPGGGFPAKCWPVESFAALAASLSGSPVVVIGGSKDREAGARIAQTGAHVRDQTGRLSLRETFALIASARLVICNSSMAMHAAAAFRRPAFVLLGEYFDSASRHAAQWGYAETRVLGKDAGRSCIWSPGEVFEQVIRTP